MIWVRVMRAARLINIVVCHLFKTDPFLGGFFIISGFIYMTNYIWCNFQHRVSLVNCNNQLQSGVNIQNRALLTQQKTDEGDSVQAVGRSPSYSKT